MMKSRQNIKRARNLSGLLPVLVIIFLGRRRTQEERGTRAQRTWRVSVVERAIYCWRGRSWWNCRRGIIKNQLFSSNTPVEVPSFKCIQFLYLSMNGIVKLIIVDDFGSTGNKINDNGKNKAVQYGTKKETTTWDNSIRWSKGKCCWCIYISTSQCIASVTTIIIIVPACQLCEKIIGILSTCTPKSNLSCPTSYLNYKLAYSRDMFWMGGLWQINSLVVFYPWKCHINNVFSFLKALPMRPGLCCMLVSNLG